MQPGEVIWFLTGLGVGLTLAIVIFAGVAFADGRRRRLSAARATFVPEAPDAAEFPAAAKTAQALRRQQPSLPEVPTGPLPDVPPEPVPQVRRRSTGMTELRNDGAPDGNVNEAMSTLAAEIARMQSSEPAQVTIDLPAAEPMQRVTVQQPPAPVGPVAPPVGRGDAARQVVEGRPAIERRSPVEPRPAVSATRPLSAATPVPPPSMTVQPTPPPVLEATSPLPEPEPPRPAPAKVPPLPRVAPARKFAPALPPRTPAKTPPGTGIKR